MLILLHICCGPCTLYPLDTLREEGLTVQGYFYNPNIHPFREFTKRRRGVEEMAAARRLTVDYHRKYGLREYLRRVVYQENRRCLLCYRMRLTAAAARAREMGADAFSTTLLYSRYQNHGQIREQGEHLARQWNIPFLYRDFRVGWQQGIEHSKKLGLYRQPYCGCIYSEQERYDR